MVKALQYDKFGGPEVLELVDVNEDHANDGKIRVNVKAVSLNPVDWVVMGNEQIGQAYGVQLPQTFAYDFAGVIDEVGAGVTDYQVGDRIFGRTNRGSAIEKLVIAADEPQIYHTPDDISDEIASALPVAGLAAVVALRTINLHSDDTLLVGGAAGGVGTFAVQLANRIGAKVYGTASATTSDFLHGLGTEQIDYGDGLVSRIKDLGLTAAVDLFSHDTVKAALEVGVAPDKISTIIMAPEPPAGVAAVTGRNATAADMQTLLDAVVAGDVVVPIAAEVPLDEYESALKQQMSRHTHGKIIITL